MARYATTIESTLSPAASFAYMADFSNAREWDPSVLDAHPEGDGTIGRGTTFQLVVVFAGRRVPLRYEIVEYEEGRRVVLEASRTGFTSRDTITVAPAAVGSTVHYDALLELHGPRRVLSPLMQLLFDRTGARAAAGLRAALAP